ncbi:MFS transporter [Cryobacterium frigoriphilum]|uniref:MFS transporter n=1 Tax=Cryobacterium frigoriphilum TaxID=1259150 RepID=A0A4R8ZX25_9MICO|nr:MFS transporter [Cryobacterium frigoriphilum]TFD48296.1 MFS transporter [Cryobacterium frigoriphilum]
MPIAMVGLFIALLPPVIVSMALKINEITPETSAASLGIVLGVGALLAMIVNPLAGRLSDRTRGRFGMRRPWIIAGVLVGYLALIVISSATTVTGVVAGWALAQTGFNAALAGVIATMADTARPKYRGRVAAAVGVAQNGSLVLGVFIVQLFSSTSLQMLVPGAVGCAIVIGWALIMKDRVRLDKPVDSFGVKEFLGSFAFNPRSNPDFGWAWLTRFLLTGAAATATTYLTFFLIANLGETAETVATQVFYATLFYTVGVLSTTFVAGWLSDRLGKRKIFVLVAALVAVVGLSTIAFAPSLAVVFAGELILGAGMGAFYAVDLALITDVLPSSEDNGKDLGVVNIAQALPQSLVPVAAPGVIALAGYPGLFLGGAVVGLFGVLAVSRVKGVK